MKKKIDS